jgi:hypothetical protein
VGKPYGNYGTLIIRYVFSHVSDLLAGERMWGNPYGKPHGKLIQWTVENVGISRGTWKANSKS